LRSRTSREIAQHFNVSRELIEYRIKVSRLWAEYKKRHPDEVRFRREQFAGNARATRT
jgi:transposase